MNKSETAARARRLYDRLMALPRPDNISNNEWAKRAGVNTSFFTNLRNGSEPSVGNLRAVLQVVGITLPEFFAAEARGRMLYAPTAQQLMQAIEDALPGLPRRPDRRAEYLADVVQAVLLLHADRPTSEDRTADRAPSAEKVLAATK